MRTFFPRTPVLSKLLLPLMAMALASPSPAQSVPARAPAAQKGLVALPKAPLTPTAPSAAPLIQVTAPGAGATIPLDAKVVQITFTQSGFSPSDNGKVFYAVELLRNGATLGVLGNPNVPISLNLNQAQAVYSATAGTYIVLPAFKEVIALPGAGYQYRVSAFKGDWQKTPVVLARGLSPTFAFGSKVAVTGSPTLQVSTPAASTTIPLDAKVLQIAFTQSGFDPYDNGKVLYAVELVRNGATLGVVGNPNVPISLNLNQAQAVYSATAGTYVVLPAFKEAIALPGTGYQYRVSAFKGDWQKAPTVLARALSPTFSFGTSTTLRAIDKIK